MLSLTIAVVFRGFSVFSETQMKAHTLPLAEPEVAKAALSPV